MCSSDLFPSHDSRGDVIELRAKAVIDVKGDATVEAVVTHFLLEFGKGVGVHFVGSYHFHLKEIPRRFIL